MDDRKTLLGVGAHEPVADAPGSPERPELPAAPPDPPDPRRALDAVVPRTKAPAETWSRHFLGISLRRAFRLHIRTDEVLPQERAILESQAAHITDPDQQAFLAWRRSVLLLVAIMFVPLTISRFFETFDLPQLPWSARLFVFLPALAEAGFCIVAFEQLRNWAQWRRQRRILFIAWALYFLAPFLVYLYPYRAVLSNTELGKLIESWSFAVGASPGKVRMVAGLTIGVAALLALGPKIISLMPGLIRASIVTKLLFPGTTAPGWLMMLAAPFYALFAYIIVLLPYQVTGSWEFVVGNLGIMGAQIFIGTCGRRLTRPISVDESHARIHKYWLAYIGILVVSAIFMIYGLQEFLRQLHYGPVRVVTALLAFVSNVLLDTLIGTDAIVAAMAHFRRRGRPDPREEELMREAETKLDVFVG